MLQLFYSHFSLIVSSIFFTGTFALAAPTADFSIQISQDKAVKSLILKPSTEHHFNLKAPSQAQRTKGKDTQPLSLKLESTSGSVVLGPLDNNCEITLELYICDDNNTYCVPQKKLLQCNDLNQQVVGAKPLDLATKSATEKKSSADELFIFNEPELALDQSQKTKKPLLVDFFGTWCPPCNVLDETVFNTPEFKQLKQDFVYLKLDADHPISWDLKSKFNVQGYPTVIFANSKGEEISRVVGSRSAKSFIQEMKSALKYKTLSLDERKKRADAVTLPEETWAFGEMYLRQEDKVNALKYFSLAAKKKNLKDKEKDLLQYLPLALMAKSSDKNLQTQSIELLKISLINFPTEETFYDKISLLNKYTEEQNDEKLKTWVQEQTLVIVDLWLKNPKLTTNTEMTVADLWSLKSAAYEELKRENESKAAYKKTAEAYLDLIQKQKLNVESSRGYNIERIYAIYKSGDFDTAERLYSQMQKIYPFEFTFFYNHAQMLKEMKKDTESYEKAEQAYKYSYGDNKLRAVYLMAELQSQKGDKKKALSLLDEVIKTTPLPANENVRTHRYVSRLKKLKETISAQK
ncbi:MAG: thioredoxin family protein [Bdellovibrionota bacterium]